MNGLRNTSNLKRLDQQNMSNIGAIIVANNTDRFDYIKLAEHCAERVIRHLKIPVSLVTDTSVSSAIFDKIIPMMPAERNQRFFTATQEKAEWRNMGRTQVYDLTPYKRTLLLDADLFIQTDALLNHLHATFDFAIARDMYDPTTGHTYKMKFGRTAMDQCWATLMIFNKCELANNIFEMAQYVLEHYNFYSKLYNFVNFPLRNDYAFTIACHLLGGYGQRTFDLANYSLSNCDFQTDVMEINAGNILIKYNDSGKICLQRIKSDLHIQNKLSLFEKINEAG
jgi:hypothetical protein